MSRYNDDGQVCAAGLELRPQFPARQPRHSSVQHHTSSYLRAESVKEIAHRSEIVAIVAGCAYQARKAVPG